MTTLKDNAILNTIRAGDLLAAEREIQTLLASDPDNLEALRLQARLLFAKQDWTGVAAQIEHILQRFSGRSPADRKKTLAHAIAEARNAMKCRAWPEAARCWRRAYDVFGDESSAEVYYGLSHACHLKGDIAEAERIAAKGLAKYDNQKIAVEYAEIALSSQDWESAAKRWRHILEKYSDTIPLKVHTRASRAYFRLEDELHAKNHIDILLHASPDDLTGLIEYKNQLYSEAFVLETIRNVWDDCSKRPNWHEILELCEMLMRVTTGNQQTGTLKQLVVANLFLREKYLTEGNWDKAFTLLKSILGKVCGTLSNQHQNLIACCIDFVCSGGSTHECNAQLLACIKNIDVNLLTRTQWLLLYDILLWNGFYFCGLAARKKAIERSHSDANSKTSTEGEITLGVVAAVDQSDFQTARQYLDRLATMNPTKKIYNELIGYYDLCSGRIDSFQAYMAQTFTPEDFIFYHYIKDKTVAIVSPAPTDSDDGQEIDSSDVVLRFNYLGQQSLPESTKAGRKTNISLYSDSILSHATENNFELHLGDLDFIIYRTMQYKIPDYLNVKGKRLKQNRHLFYRASNAVPAALYEMLAYSAGRVKVFKSNFFLSKRIYDDNYLLINFESKDLNAKEVYKNLRVSRHDPISQLTFVRNLFQHGLIEVDKDCARVIRLSNEEYMFQMEEIYTNTSHEKSILEIAELAIKEGKWEKAALRLQAILDHFGQKATPATYFQLGEAYRKLGNIPAADNVLRQGVEKYPQSLQLAINFAENSMAASDWRETANRWQSVLDSFHEKVPDGFRGSLDEHTSCGV